MPRRFQATRQAHEHLDDAFELDDWPVVGVKGVAPVEARSAIERRNGGRRAGRRATGAASSGAADKSRRGSDS